MMNLEDVGKIIFEILAVGGGATVIAYGFFRWLGQRWLDNKFSERLEKLKHEQDRELERHRFQINTLFNRVSKIHDKEFEVLPDAWSKLQDALGYVSQFTSPLQTYPDFRYKSQKEFEEFLQNSNFNESDKQKLIDSDDRQKTYQEIIFWYDLRDTKKAVNDFHNFLLKNRIFLSKNLFEKFGELDTLLSSSVTDREIGHTSRDNKMKAGAYKIFGDDLNLLVSEVEELVQKRLHFEDAK